MSEDKAFLADKVAGHDAVLLEVLAEPAPQHLRARLITVYSARHGLAGQAPGAQIDFVHAPSSWGNTPLAPGDLAIVFLNTISGRLYEAAWNGHLLVDDIDGRPHAIYKHKELWLNEAFPPEIRAHARQDPARPYASAIEFDAVETYLSGLIAHSA
ncbi:hypothetical protein [Massilia antarctica]|uniref:hypothetical protein n=1 Tax=Massilia antarctica TaxID=2765360 RepID=UPI0006BB883D|nr:hypothetical protein [Massilia sp. H27-R4]MCY0915054.1 hypothetical protein [Massilia sp. H27-R4]CUI07026.1 hypothetical protein BN2497_8829 [Janthinobacterium sp. CG23_2]CUU30812.1 hypothetical protein BN3177_8829 [Janthinobacterium sp. CG23_2]